MSGHYDTEESEFDYVIVGAGSAGCVLANRLSADPDTRVLLIEAGPPDTHWSIRMPLAVLLLMRDKLRNWQFQTQPEPQLGNRSLFWPRGRVLGGSSSINGMIYIRGQREDYDHWAALGNKGWSYAELLPAFKALETNERGTSEYHGADGELRVSDSRMEHPLSDKFLEACRQAGYPETPDFNGAQQAGAGRFQMTQSGGERHSASAAFLQPVLDRPDLFVQTNAHVTRLLQDGKRVTGVAYKHKGADRQAQAAHEVILCGGALQSPQTLLLSGIGPTAELDKHGIAVRHELAGVGRNLQDHADILITNADKSNRGIHFGLSGLWQNLRALWAYFRHRRGNATAAVEAGAFVPLGDETGGRPNVQYHFFPTIIKDHARKFAYHAGYSLHACVLRPKSRGRIGLQSADPLAPPAIETGYFTDPADMQLMKHAVRDARRILGQPAFADTRKREEEPGDEVTSDEELEDYIRARTETIYHPVGTCKMGNDNTAVVDDQLRVHGLQGLRVADASIMPTLISGNTNATSMLIGERCAQMVLADREQTSDQEAELRRGAA